MKSSFFLLSLLFIGCMNQKDNFKIDIGNKRIITLIKFPHADNKIRLHPSHFTEKDYSEGIKDFEGLGMENVPVLDQGAHGTCVTFAATASMDALLKNGDLISQECSLALDKALGQNYWEGAYYPSQIIDPLKKYGIVSKSKCPKSYGDESYSLPPLKYGKYIDKENSILVKQMTVKYYDDPSIESLREAIDRGHRVMIGFLLDGSDKVAVRGFDIKIDNNLYSGGLWACEQDGKNVCEKNNAGHEVIVIGYDDSQELVKIRNSWSEEVGKEGDYYMSYKYFEDQVLDMSEIW